MHGDRARAGSFGADAEQYDRARPDYPPAMLDDLLVDGAVSVLDVGCGTGIASRLFEQRGCRVVGVEPDARMAAVARGHGLVVEDGTFEEWDPAGRTFDLLVSAQAWHWVDPVAGAAKATEVLRPGGRIGLFWNQGRHPDPLRADIEAIYQRLTPGLDEHSILLRNLGEERFRETAATLADNGGFRDLDVRRYGWDRRYTRDEWLDHLPTHSDHRLLPPDRRAALLSAIGDVIDGAGGSFAMHYDCWLVTACRNR